MVLIHILLFPIKNLKERILLWEGWKESEPDRAAWTGRVVPKLLWWWLSLHELSPFWVAQSTFLTTYSTHFLCTTQENPQNKIHPRHHRIFTLYSTTRLTTYSTIFTSNQQIFILNNIKYPFNQSLAQFITNIILDFINQS